MVKELPGTETALASIQYVAHDLVEVRFKEGVKLTPGSIQDMMKARRQIDHDGRHKVLMILQQEVDFSMEMISMDHYEVVPQPNTDAVAWVAHNEANMIVTKLYLTHMPPPFPSRVFLTEQEGREWLRSVS